jgi:hypothetical protein
MTDQLTDVQILDTIIGGIRVKDMSALVMYGVIARAINNTDANDPRVRILRTAVSVPPITRNIAEETKIKYIRMLIELGTLKI